MVNCRNKSTSNVRRNTKKKKNDCDSNQGLWQDEQPRSRESTALCPLRHRISQKTKKKTYIDVRSDFQRKCNFLVGVASVDYTAQRSVLEMRKGIINFEEHFLYALMLTKMSTNTPTSPTNFLCPINQSEISMRRSCFVNINKSASSCTQRLSEHKGLMYNNIRSHVPGLPGLVPLRRKSTVNYVTLTNVRCHLLKFLKYCLTRRPCASAGLQNTAKSCT